MASGDTLLRFHSYDNEPTSSNSAVLVTRNAHPVLAFDDTTAEYAVFSDVIPQNYSGVTGVTVYIHYAMATATSGDIDWDVSFERVGEGQIDIDSDGFAAVNSVDGTSVPATSGHIDIVSVAFTDGADMDSVASGEGFRMKISRGVPDDTATGDAQLRWVEIRET